MKIRNLPQKAKKYEDFCPTEDCFRRFSVIVFGIRLDKLEIFAKF